MSHLSAHTLPTLPGRETSVPSAGRTPLPPSPGREKSVPSSGFWQKNRQHPDRGRQLIIPPGR